MDSKEFLQLAKKRYATVITFILVFIIISLIGTLVQPLKYRTTSRLLISQPDTTADAYSIARSNQYIGGLISEVIYSGAFLEALNSSDAVFDRNYFSGTYKQNLKKWKKTVFARSGGDSGVIEIEIYHPNPNEARQIALAVNNNIITGQGPYQFTGKQTKITTIDQPITSSFPVNPNIPLNVAASLFFGTLFGFSYIYFFPVSQSDKMFNKVKKAKKIRKIIIQTAYQSNENKVKVSATAKFTQAPPNLPIYPHEEIIEDTKWPEDEPVTFQGNIHNVLGE